MIVLDGYSYISDPVRLDLDESNENDNENYGLIRLISYDNEGNVANLDMEWMDSDTCNDYMNFYRYAMDEQVPESEINWNDPDFEMAQSMGYAYTYIHKGMICGYSNNSMACPMDWMKMQCKLVFIHGPWEGVTWECRECMLISRYTQIGLK